MLSMPGKISEDILGDNVHEISKPIFWEIQEKYFKMLSSVELAHGVVKVK